MNGFLRLLLIVLMAGSMVRCATGDGEFQSEGGVSDSDFAQFDAPAEPAATPEAAPEEAAPDAAPQIAEQPAPPSDPMDQEFSVADEAAGDQQAQVAPPAAAPEEQALEDEFSQFDQAPVDQAQVPSVEEVPPPAVAEQVPPPATEEPELTLEEPAPTEPLVAQTEEEFPPPSVDLPPDPAPEPAPIVAAEPPPAETPAPQESGDVASTGRVAIKAIRYKPNDNGGTVAIEATGPITFTTRKNPDTNQLVVEIPNATLPKRLKRPFNTKDMRGGIGSVDAYQNSGSSTARIVIQLRKGADEPVVQAEGNAILVVESSGMAGGSSSTVAANEPSEMDSEESADAEATAQSRILSTQSLDQFLAGNTEFFGKKISVETTDMDIRDVIKLISEESGINLVLSDDVKGTVNVKLRQVPWDQALVVIMKMKRLGYTRAGNILRITSLTELKNEEDESVRQNNAKKAQVALKVRVVPVSYAKIDDIVGQVKPFLSDRGKVVGDNRTSSMVISDLDENIERAMKLITSIDVPPLQVLIEGKVVEASDNFQRSIGINWAGSGRPVAFGSSSRGEIRSLTSIGQTTTSDAAGTLGVRFQMGTLDVLGDLNASLSLLESQDMVKVLSSPRIVTLHNEPAEINQVTQIPIVTTSLANGQSQQSVTFKDVKLKLGVTPQITNDAAVIMGVDVVREFLGGTQDKESGAVPINSRTAKTKVMVKNGQTAVIGGIYQSDSQTGESRVPWLADIPLFGWLFKSRDTKNQKNELLIFLTPRILGQADSQAIPSNSTGELQ